MPSPWSSPPWNCLELTQPIGRRGDPGAGPHSTKPRRRFQETFSQYASRIWPRASTRFKDPHCWPTELEQESSLPSADPNGNPTTRAPPSPQQLPNRNRATRRRRRRAAPTTNCNWRKRKSGSFPPFAPPEAAGDWDSGMGENRGGEPGVGIKTEPCRRKSRDVGPREISPPLSLAVSDGLMLWSLFCLVFGKHSVSWSIPFPFCSGVFFPSSLCPLFSIFMQKITFVGEKKR